MKLGVYVAVTVDDRVGSCVNVKVVLTCCVEESERERSGDGVCVWVSVGDSEGELLIVGVGVPVDVSCCVDDDVREFSSLIEVVRVGVGDLVSDASLENESVSVNDMDDVFVCTKIVSDSVGDREVVRVSSLVGDLVNDSEGETVLVDVFSSDCVSLDVFDDVDSDDAEREVVGDRDNVLDGVPFEIVGVRDPVGSSVRVFDRLRLRLPIVTV